MTFSAITGHSSTKWIIKSNALLLLIAVTVFALSCSTTSQPSGSLDVGKQALENSADPIRPGIPGERPFWNGHAWRFIWAPAFDFKTVEGASGYHFEVVSMDGGDSFTFESEVPHAPLSPVWTKMPVGNYKLTVSGVSDGGKKIAVAGTREFYRAATFNGIYHRPVLPYDSSAMLALKNVLNKDYVE